MNSIKTIFARVVMCSTVLTINSIFAVDNDQKFNQLNWVEVTENEASMQVMFDFAQPFHYKKEVIKDKSQLVLSFPGMRPHEFDSDKVSKEISKLKNYGILQHIEVKESKDDNDVVPAMTLVFTFAPTRMMKNEKDISTSVKNQLSIIWSMVDNQKPHEPSFRLVLDIFAKEVLDKIEQQPEIRITHAQNNVPSKKKILV